MTTRLHLKIRGRVQGVGFRWFARDAASRLQVAGWVRNLPTGEVEAEAEGDREALDRFVTELKTGLPYARVESIAQKEIPPKGERGFDIQ